MASLRDQLVNMKLNKSMEAKTECCPEPVREDYPWGLRVDLHDESMKALGKKAKDFNVGEELMLVAKVEVVRVSSSAGKDHSDESVELQIKEMTFKEDSDGKE